MHVRVDPARRSKPHRPAARRRLPPHLRDARQARSREKLARLLDAGEALIAAQGFEGTRLADVAAAAGCAVGTFYQRFRDKDALLEALQERMCDDIRASVERGLVPERFAGAALDRVVTGLVAAMVERFRRHRAVLRALQYRAEEHPEMRQRMRALNALVADRLLALLRQRQADLARGDLELRVRFGLQVVFGTLVNTVFNEPRGLAIGDERLAPELARVLVGYLGIAPAATPRGRRRA
jgi:AcrR family transcriptional regulator